MEDLSLKILTPKEKQIFKKFKYSDTVVLTRDEWNILLNTGLIKEHLGGKSSWFDDQPDQGIAELSDRGIRYREYQKMQTKSKRKETFHSYSCSLLQAFGTIIGAIKQICTFFHSPN